MRRARLDGPTPPPVRDGMRVGELGSLGAKLFDALRQLERQTQLQRRDEIEVMIRDGETMVIGGVFIDSQNNSVAGIPYLSRVPVLGWLFKQKTESVAKQELLIFLTPSIVKS